VPVACFITSSEGADVLANFLTELRSAVQVQATGGSDFDFGYIMIDKSPTEMAAIRVACGGQERHLFCWFHFQQEWDRFSR
jgi:hypothetical protein